MDSLFDLNIDDFAIDISQLHSINGFDEIYNLSHKIKLNSYNVLRLFFSKEQEIVFDYYVDCQYNEVANNYRMRFMIVKGDDDYYLIPLKIVDPIDKSKSKRYFTLSYKILPLKGSDTRKVYELLSKYIHEVTISTQDCNNPDNVVFYNTKESANSMQSSKWRSKNGINVLKDVVNSTLYNIVPIDTTGKILELNNKWTLAKNKKTPNKLIQDFCRGSIGYTITYTYGDKIVGFQIVTIGYNDTATCHISKSYFDDIDNKLIHNYLGSYMIFWLHEVCFNKLNAKAVNYLGVRDIKKYNTLYKFKSKYFKRNTKYKKVSIQTLLTK